MNKELNVFSACDGISCGMVALECAGIKVDKYYASEIEPNAIKISQKNYPDIIRLGDLTKWREWDIDWSSIDLIIGGTPCQSVSIVQSKTRENLDGKSKLFFDYADILNHVRSINPNVLFLLENVASMNTESKKVISEYMGCEPYLIDSRCFSAQQRPRYYWTNIPVDINGLKESPFTIKDILCNDVPEKYYYNFPLVDIDMSKQVCATMVHNNNEMHKRVFNPDFKCHTLTCVSGGNQQKKVLVDEKCRKLMPIEYERLQTIPMLITNMNINFNTKEISFNRCHKRYIKKINAQYVGEKNHTKQKHVLTVENVDQKEYVQFAEKSLSLNNPQINKHAQLNVHINLEELTNQKNCSKEKKRNVSIAEENLKFLPVKKRENFALAIVGMHLLLEKMRQDGKVELRQKDKIFATVENGKMQLLLCGKEMMQLAKDAELDMSMIKKLITYIIYEAGQAIQNSEQMLIILFFFVLNVIDSFIQMKTVKEISFMIEEGYTYGVSDGSRYTACGNGWTVDVVAHIFSFIKDV